MHFYGLNLVKDHYAMLYTKFQASKPNSSIEEDFFNIFLNLVKDY